MTPSALAMAPVSALPTARATAATALPTAPNEQLWTPTSRIVDAGAAIAVPAGTVAPMYQQVMLTQRRAVDLCRVATCLCCAR